MKEVYDHHIFAQNLDLMYCVAPTEIEAEWGDAFNMTSLGGMLTLGKTGLQAAMAHSPPQSPIMLLFSFH